jgi:hypothetical protein
MVTMHYNLSYVQHERRCRFCKGTIVSPKHAMLECQSSTAILNMRNICLEKLFQTVPKLQKKMVKLTSVEFLKAMIYERSTIILVAKFVHEVLQEFYAVLVYRMSFVPWGIGYCSGY